MASNTKLLNFLGIAWVPELGGHTNVLYIGSAKDYKILLNNHKSCGLLQSSQYQKMPVFILIGRSNGKDNHV